MGVTTIDQSTDLSGWVPVRAANVDGDVAISWCWANDARFDEPFWTETASRLMADPFRLLFQHTGCLGDLRCHAERHPAIAPSGFVYHLSRCGSTLIGRALGSLPGVRLLSEPAPLDHLVRALEHHSNDEQRDAVRWMLSALSPQYSPEDRQLVVKLDAWHIHLFPLLRRAFPTVPWIFVSRDPVEVMASHKRQRGAQMIRGALPRHVVRVPEGDLSPLEYGAHALNSMLESALRYHDDGGLLVDYSELPGAITERIAPHFGIAPGDVSASVLGTHAKNPVLPFTADTNVKQAVLSHEARHDIERVVGATHRSFEQARLIGLRP